MSKPLPKCIKAIRIGRYAESEYDADGALAPITWVCACGNQMPLARMDHTERYVPTSEAALAEFLAKHSHCTFVCYNCAKVEVEYHSGWCDNCV